jgi:osmotically-inducible protein OsmY
MDDRRLRAAAAAALLGAALALTGAGAPAGAPDVPAAPEKAPPASPGAGDQDARDGEDDSTVAPIPEGYDRLPRRNIAGPGDYAIREKLTRVLARDPDLASEKYYVILVNGGVVFSGEMTTCALKQRVLRTAAAIRGVVNVTDEMRVAGAGVGDDELEQAVGGLLADAAAEVGLKDLEVESEGGVVTLTGTVRDFQARVRAEDLAATVVGVSRVANRLRAADAPGGGDDGSLARAVVAYLSDFRLFPYPAEIDVEVRDGVAFLTGRVGLYIARTLAGNMANQVRGLARVDNQIRVDPSLGPVRASVRLKPR